MAKLDGRLIALQIEGVTLIGRTTSSLNFSADMLDATTADSNGYKEYESGENGGTASVGGLYDPDAAEGFSEALGYLMAGTKLNIKWGETATGGTYWDCDAIISSVSINGDKNTLMAYTIDLQLTGDWKEQVVSGS